jgi:hypothetical protein
MKLALNESRGRLVALGPSEVRLFDIASGTPKLVATRSLESGHCLTACGASLAVLAGPEAPTGKSVRRATLARFDWDLAPLGEAPLGSVEKRSVALDADGKRVAFADWGASEVVVADATSGRRLASAGDGIPSGPSWSPDGKRVLAGFADQGSGAIVLFEVADDALRAAELPESAPSPGLDDAPYFTAFGQAGDLAVVSNESWGGRGLFVYDVASGKPLWSKVLDGSSEEAEEWHAFVAAFASRDTLLLVASPGEVRAYGARDGRDLGTLQVPGDGHDGFAVEQAARRVWVAGETPTVHPFPPAWALGPRNLSLRAFARVASAPGEQGQPPRWARCRDNGHVGRSREAPRTLRCPALVLRTRAFG